MRLQKLLQRFPIDGSALRTADAVDPKLQFSYPQLLKEVHRQCDDLRVRHHVFRTEDFDA